MLRTRVARVVTLTGYFGLILLLTVWNAWLDPPQSFPRSLVLVVLLAPLLFPLRGLLHGKPYTHAWTSFLALVYFTLGVGVTYAAPQERIYGVLEIVFSVLLYTGAMLYARYRSREIRSTR